MSAIQSVTARKLPRRCQQAKRQIAVNSAQLPRDLKRTEQQAWASNSERLGGFFLTQVNRQDAVGQYLSDSGLDSRKKVITERKKVDLHILQRHFAATNRGNLIGLHSTSPENTCRWFVIDIDQHHESNPQLAERNEQAALAFFNRLIELGATPLLIDSNGRGGFHIWVFFSMPVSSVKLHAWGLQLIADFEIFGIERPEFFPRQAKLKPEQLGNFVRLPGRHHTYDFYSRIWDGNQWLRGEAAIDRICNVQLCSPEVVSGAASAGNHRKPTRKSAVVEFNAVIDSQVGEKTAAILRKLGELIRSRSGWMACCPAHDDVNPSLSVSESEDGRVLLHCHAGCKNQQVLDSLQIQWADLYPSSAQTSERELRINDSDIQPQTQPGIALRKMRQKYKKLLRLTTHDHLKTLAEQLCVSIESLRNLGVAWSSKHNCWIIPERDGQRQICGLMRRNSDGSKRMVAGGSRGLYLPKSFDPTEERILIAEGASDTLAGMTRGWNIIGRPSADGGVKELMTLLKSSKGEIFVVADNDSKRDGSWPGRTGAERVAQRLAAEIHPTVNVTHPPMDFKDLREWLKTVEVSG